MCEPYSQGATQPLDATEDSISEEEAHDELPYWGRLYPASRNVKFHELTGDEVTVGKLQSCGVCITSEEVPNDTWVVISRKQFSISRIQQEVLGLSLSAIQLTDLSMNGTFINGKKVGKGLSKDLEDNDVISVGRPHFKVYYFKKGVLNDAFPKSLQEKYDVSDRLGTGAFGEVHRVFNKETGKGFAMKTIINDGLSNQRRLENEMKKLVNEIKILRTIKHPNVIQLIDDMTFNSKKYLFLELMEGNDLFNRIQTSKRLTEPQAKLYFYQIASGVQYLHSHGIIHRDLKPENVLLATDDVETLVKITDFGLSKVTTSHSYLLTLCGTKLYVAPEVLESGGSKKYTGLVDVWSMGVILYVCLSGQTPFAPERKGLSMEEQIKKGIYTMPKSAWECVSSAAVKVVRRMMTPNPKHRISIVDIFKHPWLQDTAMKSKVSELVALFGSAYQDKENVPRGVTEGNGDTTPPSPYPATSVWSPPATSDWLPHSPPRKRTRIH